jgi:cellulose synthase/poly-beta-1,6-N-acetylglucosamine synthase-like glycosyltransferase
MISVLIPVYNHDVTRLVQTIHAQALQTSHTFEIIVMDDKSDISYRKVNRVIGDLDHVKYVELKQNIGRSKIRNKMAGMAFNDYLLFLDCDSEVFTDDYFKKYITLCEGEVVIYGGRKYRQSPPVDLSLFLHWYYGKSREEIPLEERIKKPNCSFMTNNFLISKSVFDKICFNETIRRYGHEDTLFGYELKKNNIEIQHIDNPLFHIGLENSGDFIRKTEIGLNNLRTILNSNGYEKQFVQDITVLKFYRRLKRFHLHGIAVALYYYFKKTLIRNLTGKSPKLYLFDIYKLGYLSSVLKKS